MFAFARLAVRHGGTRKGKKMSRTRSIKPEFWDDEKLAMQCSRDARLLFIGLWGQSDDYGVVKGHPVWIKNQVFPYENIMETDIKKWLSELEKVNAIIPFVSHIEKYYFIRTFLNHQKISHPSKARNPLPPADIEKHSGNTPETLRRHSGNPPSETETETETRDTSVSLSVSPTDDVKKIFDYHGERIGNCRKLTPMRKQKITSRLKDGFSVDDLCLIIDFTAQDSFWSGDNDQGKAYNQVDTIFRSTEKTENNLNDARKWNNNGRAKKSNIKGLDGLRKFAKRHNVGGVND